MQIDGLTLLCPACKGGNIQYRSGVYECLTEKCGVEGPEAAFKAWRAPVDKDTLRAALEWAVRPLEWSQLSDKTLATFCPLSGHRLTATSESGQTQQQNATTARILAAVDIDALAAKLGGGPNV